MALFNRWKPLPLLLYLDAESHRGSYDTCFSVFSTLITLLFRFLALAPEDMAQKADKVKRKPSAVEVPAKGEDPAERKRVLNVLAQRRYRQRRREHVKKLEAQTAKVRTGDQTADEDKQQPVETSLALGKSQSVKFNRLVIS